MAPIAAAPRARKRKQEDAAAQEDKYRYVTKLASGRWVASRRLGFKFVPGAHDNAKSAAEAAAAAWNMTLRSCVKTSSGVASRAWTTTELAAPVVSESPKGNRLPERQIQPADSQDSEEDDEFGEEEETLPVPQQPSRPTLPSQQEQADHNLVHRPFAAWCENCIRAKDQQHRRQLQQPGEAELPVAHIDYSFANLRAARCRAVRATYSCFAGGRVAFEVQVRLSVDCQGTDRPGHRPVADPVVLGMWLDRASAFAHRPRACCDGCCIGGCCRSNLVNNP